jgi:hypothetical protein
MQRRGGAYLRERPDAKLWRLRRVRDLTYQKEHDPYSDALETLLRGFKEGCGDMPI